jgi:hypothetical protein
MGLSSLRDLLAGSAFNRPGVRRSITASMIVQAANRILPGYLSGMQAREVKAISFRGGILRVQTKNSAAKFGMKGIENSILIRLREDFPSQKIDRIQVHISKEPSEYEHP